MQINYEELIKDCYQNIKKIDLNNPECLKKYDDLVRYLMTEKISDWSIEDVTVIIHFLSHKAIVENNIDTKLLVNIIDDEKYLLYPTCYNKTKCGINYNKSVFDSLIGCPNIFGLQGIFKEISFILLDKKLRENNKFDKYTYIIAIENLVRGIKTDLYYANKKHLFREAQANNYGFECSLKFIEMYNKGLYDTIIKNKQEDIKKFKQSYIKSYSDESFYLSKEFNDFDTVVSEYLQLRPDVIDIYPILNVAYNSDGIRKDIIELLNDRNNLLLEYDRKEIDDLYYAVCNYKDYYQVDEKGALGECEKIIKYIYETNDTDEFVIELLRHRLKFSNEDENQIDTLIEKIKQTSYTKKLKRDTKGAN